jgi:RNA polymerase sigma-70 factor (ECF subfamily)
MGANPSDADAPELARTKEDPSSSSWPFEDLAALYDTCGGPVYRLALRLCRSRQEAEDLSHDVFLRYWQHNRYEPARGPVLAYLLLLTRSMAINRLQKRRNRWQLVQRWSEQLFPTAVPGPHDHAEAENLAERVRAALASIPASQREVLEMAYYEGLSQSAIGERLRVPLGTVKTRARQGLIRLRELLIDFRSDP